MSAEYVANAIRRINGFCSEHGPCYKVSPISGRGRGGVFVSAKHRMIDGIQNMLFSETDIGELPPAADALDWKPMSTNAIINEFVCKLSIEGYDGILCRAVWPQSSASVSRERGRRVETLEIVGNEDYVVYLPGSIDVNLVVELSKKFGTVLVNLEDITRSWRDALVSADLSLVHGGSLVVLNGVRYTPLKYRRGHRKKVVAEKRRSLLPYSAGRIRARSVDGLINAAWTVFDERIGSFRSYMDRRGYGRDLAGNISTLYCLMSSLKSMRAIGAFKKTKRWREFLRYYPHFVESKSEGYSRCVTVLKQIKDEFG